MGFLHRHRILAIANERDALLAQGVSLKEAKQRARVACEKGVPAAQIVHVDEHTRRAPRRRASAKKATKAKRARRGAKKAKA